MYSNQEPSTDELLDMLAAQQPRPEEGLMPPALGAQESLSPGFMSERVGEPEVSADALSEMSTDALLDALASQEVGVPEEQAPLPEGIARRAGEFGRAFASGTGSTMDILGSGITDEGAQFMKGMPREVPEEPYRPDASQDIFQRREALERAAGSPERVEMETPFAESLPESVGLGERFEPRDIPGKIIAGAGHFLAPAPFPLGGYGHAAKEIGKGGLKLLPKVAAKEAGMAIGASAAGQTPKMAEEGTALSAVEDMAKGIFGGMAGRGLSKKSMTIGEKIIKDGIAKTAKDGPKNLAAKLASMGSRPQKEVFKMAEKHGIDLPFNVGMDSRAMNFTANNYLKSMFTSRVYEDALRNSDESMVRAVKKSINKLSPQDLKPSEGSVSFKRFLKVQEKEAEEMVGKLYENADSLLKKGDSVVPRNTLKSISNMKELLTRDVRSPATKKVSAIVKELADTWEIGPKISKKVEQQYGDSPIIIEKYIEALGKANKPIPIEKLIGVRKELGTITKHDPDIKGVEAWINGLKHQIDKDIDSSANKAFVEAYRDANKVFKQDVADRFRGSMARGIISGEMPNEAFSLLNSSKNIKQLEKIAGTSKESKEIFNALKKAKVKEVFANSLKDESLALGPFTNIFTKGEVKRELLSELMGKKEFKNLEEISKIAKTFQKAGRDLLNTSGTAIASADIAKSEKLVKSALQAFLGGSVAGIPGAATSVVMPNLLSRLAANKGFIQFTRNYAVARQAGKEMHARTILQKIIPIAEKEARIAAHLAKPAKKKEEK